MKRLFSVFFILLGTLLSTCTLTNAQTNYIQYNNQVFEVIYSEDYEQPLEVKYVVDCWDGGYSRAGLNFYKVEGIHTSDNADYKNNVWDKGHMAPAASFSCDETELRLTFSYLNCALQHEGLNRGPWKDLEAQERKLAEQYGKVEVHIEVIFERINENRLPSGAVVPTAFKKTIKYGNITKVYLFPNKDVRQQDYNYFYQ
jgi:DNA/RNA endonuclease G (NUC1)